MKKIIKENMLCDNLSVIKQEQISKIASSIINTEAFKSNIVCFTTDVDTFSNSVILLNTAIYLTHVNKKVLIYDLDFKNKYILAAINNGNNEQNSAVNSKFKNIEYISYDNKEIFIQEIRGKQSLEDVYETFKNYDLVLVNLPSVIDDSTYLSLPDMFASFIITIKRYKSKTSRINKMIDKIKFDQKFVIGSVFDESIR